jgi:hypothetical protein
MLKLAILILEWSIVLAGPTRCQELKQTGTCAVWNQTGFFLAGLCVPLSDLCGSVLS